MKNDKTMFEIMRKQVLRLVGGSVLLAAGIKLFVEAGCQHGVTTTEKLLRELDPESYEVIDRKFADFVNTH